jgi:hypothetical protein
VPRERGTLITHCPGCARMHQIQPCFPGCNGQTDAGVFIGAGKNLGGQTDSAGQSTACSDLKSDPSPAASEAVPLGFGLRAQYVLGARAPTTTMAIGQSTQSSACAPKRVDGDGEPLPANTTPRKETAA